MSRNLIKASQFVLKESEPVVVDTNPLIEKRLGTFFSDADGEGFQTGLNAPEIDLSQYEVEGESEEESTEYAGPSAEELLQNAHDEIEAMRAEAENEIQQLKESSRTEGRKEGYEEGKQQALQEAESMKQEWKQKCDLLEAEYQKKIDELEPKFVETLTGIYEKIFQVELSQYKPILVHAISNTIRHTEGTKDFLVHISRKDYEEVVQHKGEIMEQLPSQAATVELIEDSTLKENECMIETGSGIYDCSLGMQLEELTRRLKLLSFES